MIQTIGIVRHFKVTYKPDSLWMTSDQFSEWVKQYNLSDIALDDYNGQNYDWELCYSSTLSRARTTANYIYDGKVVNTDELKEIEAHPVFKSSIKLHYMVWLIMSRIAWYFSLTSRQERKGETILRAKQFIERIEAGKETRVLVVSHGAFMKTLCDELTKQGYTGSRFLKPRNGVLYTFQRS